MSSETPAPAPSTNPLARLESGGLSGDNRYYCDTGDLQKLRSESPWKNDPKYFQKVAISPSAVMKMMMHCDSGVQKGVAKGGNPIEVMGLLLGRPDPLTPKTLIVTDAFPLPIEGFETRVIADDQNVVNHMIALGECLERSRREKFMGWYHSHPFDLSENSHCFLSQTDLSTQLQWQRSEDPHGNPFVAIVVDPLRSLHYQIPELKAFRAYPPEYNSPVANECPNGTVEASEQIRLEQWGSCWNRYYELPVEYFMSSTSRSILEQLTQDYLWMRTLASGKNTSGESSTKALTKKLIASRSQFQSSMASTSANRSSFRMDHPATVSGSSSSGAMSSSGASNSLHAPVQSVVDLATEELLETVLQATKEKVFSSSAPSRN